MMLIAALASVVIASCHDGDTAPPFNLIFDESCFLEMLKNLDLFWRITLDDSARIVVSGHAEIYWRYLSFGR